jgi:hypothetical protein
MKYIIPIIPYQNVIVKINNNDDNNNNDYYYL